MRRWVEQEDAITGLRVMRTQCSMEMGLLLDDGIERIDAMEGLMMAMLSCTC